MSCMTYAAGEDNADTSVQMLRTVGHLGDERKLVGVLDRLPTHCSGRVTPVGVCVDDLAFHTNYGRFRGGVRLARGEILLQQAQRPALHLELGQYILRLSR